MATTTVTGVDDGTTGYAVQGTTAQALHNGSWTAGVRGVSASTYGVYGRSQSGVGVYGHTEATNGSYAIWAEHEGSGDGCAGLFAICSAGSGVRGSGVIGVEGTSYDSGGTVTGIGVSGRGEIGVSGLGLSGTGVMGKNGAGSGINIDFGGGVRGDSDNGWGVIGTSSTYDGVRGEINGNGNAIHGVCHSSGGKAALFEGNIQVNGATQLNGVVNSGFEITAYVSSGDGVTGWTKDGNKSGVVALNENGGHGVYAKSSGAAGYFDGNVVVNGNLQVSNDIVLSGADCAEEFDIAEQVSAEPGTVMVLTEGGALTPCFVANDRRVAGVMSGAGAFRPALTLDRRVGSKGPRGALALVGKAFCKVDARNRPVDIGDLLVTSDLIGHAMATADPAKATGAVIGKAMARLEQGSTGMIPILIALQ